MMQLSLAPRSLSTFYCWPNAGTSFTRSQASLPWQRSLIRKWNVSSLGSWEMTWWVVELVTAKRFLPGWRKYKFSDFLFLQVNDGSNEEPLPDPTDEITEAKWEADWDEQLKELAQCYEANSPYSTCPNMARGQLIKSKDVRGILAQSKWRLLLILSVAMLLFLYSSLFTFHQTNKLFCRTE